MGCSSAVEDVTFDNQTLLAFSVGGQSFFQTSIGGLYLGSLSPGFPAARPVQARSLEEFTTCFDR